MHLEGKSLSPSITAKSTLMSSPRPALCNLCPQRRLLVPLPSQTLPETCARHSTVAGRTQKSTRRARVCTLARGEGKSGGGEGIDLLYDSRDSRAIGVRFSHARQCVRTDVAMRVYCIAGLRNVHGRGLVAYSARLVWCACAGEEGESGLSTPEVRWPVSLCTCCAAPPCRCRSVHCRANWPRRRVARDS